MNRREFLKTSFAIGSAAYAGRSLALAADKKFILSAPLTHSDWMLKPNIPWGPPGVKHMLDTCKSAGLSQIYWRVLDGGRADYPSKVVRPFAGWDDDSFWTPQSPQDKALSARYTANVTPHRRAELLEKFKQLDYSNWDCLAEAISYGHSIGLKIHAWVSINEDDHGWGLISDFSKNHPEFRWKHRDGRAYHSQLDFKFKEVRDYKLSILRELVTNYKIDGLFLDWVRTGDVRDNPQTDANGLADYGSDTTGTTLFMRDARKLTTLPISAMVGHPWLYRGEMDKITGNPKGLLLDVPTWSRENLVDSLIPAGYYRDGGTSQLAYNAVRKESDNRLPIWLYAWVPQNPAEFNSALSTAETVGADHILFWEADYLDDRPNREELFRAMRACAV